MNDKKVVKQKNGLLIFLTILSSLAFCIMKLFNFGWLSIIFFIPIFYYLVLFNISNILNAEITTKKKCDYLRYWLLNFFFLLSGLTFCDLNDAGITSQILQFISADFSKYVCQFSVVITVLLCIISIVIYTKKKKQNNITLNNQ